MGIELQIRSEVLERLVYRSTQDAVRKLCWKSALTLYVDHIDVVQDGVELSPAAGGVALRVRVDVYVVTEAGLQLTPDGAPRGATTAAGRGEVELTLACTPQGLLTITCTALAIEDLGPDATDAIAPITDAIRDGIGEIARIDLATALKRLDAELSNLALDLVDGVVLVRFGASAPPVSRLSAGQDWGLFVAGATIERVLDREVPGRPGGKVTSMHTTPHWRQQGATAHVDVDFAGKADVDDPWAGDFSGTFGCSLALGPGSAQQMQATVDWSFEIDAGVLVPGGVEDQIVDGVTEHMDPARFGGFPLGERRFALNLPLPVLRMGGVHLIYTGLLASREGMTLGGTAQFTVDPSRSVLDLTVQRFTKPARVDFCSLLAEVGSDVPDPITRIEDLTTSAWVTMTDCGRFCGVEVLGSDRALIEPYLHAPAPGTDSEGDEIAIHLPAAVARAIAGPVRLRIRTARGVRIRTLGVPPHVRPDGQGGFQDIIHSYIDDCLYRVHGPSDDVGIEWATVGVAGVTGGHEVEWGAFLRGRHGLKVHLVHFQGLEAGELVRFRSSDHTIEVVADADGTALMPVLLSPLGSARGALVRASGEDVRGHFTVRTAVFLPETAGGAEERRPSANGAKRAESRLRDMVAEVALPGFEAEPITIATLADGSMRILDHRGEGFARVAGSVEGPFGALATIGGQGVAGPVRASVFTLRTG